MQGFTRDYKGIEGITRVYKDLQGVTRDYMGFQIKDYRRLQGYMWVYKGFTGGCGKVYMGLQGYTRQGAKKVVSNSPGLVDFAIGLVNSVLNLPDGQAKIFRRIKITKVLYIKCFKFLINSCGPKVAPTK